jgi:hypothetical protein
VRINSIIRIGALVFIPCLFVNTVFAELSQKQARRLISKAAGMSLPTSAVRIESINSTNESTAEASTELQLVFRFARDEAGHWQIREVRTGEAQWESVEVMAQATKLELTENRCGAIDELGRTKPQSDLTVKQARCLIASLFGVSLPSDAVRIKEISGLSLGSEPSAIVESLVRMYFRFVKDSRGWRVSEFHSGNRPWITLESVPSTVDSLKRAKTNEDMNAVAAALEAFRRVRGSFVVTQKHSVLIDNLTPHYLHKVIRLDAWHHPYQYQGDADHFTIRSFGPDGKENTADDIVVSR